MALPGINSKLAVGVLTSLYKKSSGTNIGRVGSVLVLRVGTITTTDGNDNLTGGGVEDADTDSVAGTTSLPKTRSVGESLLLITELSLSSITPTCWGLIAPLSSCSWSNSNWLQQTTPFLPVHPGPWVDPDF